MTPEELTEHLEAHPFRFAKTMPQWPHFYTLRSEWEDEQLFNEVVQAIRDLGEKRPWPPAPAKPKYRNIYFDGGKWSYWTMGAKPEKTTLINRADRYHPTTAKSPDDQPESEPAEVVEPQEEPQTVPAEAEPVTEPVAPPEEPVEPPEEPPAPTEPDDAPEDEPEEPDEIVPVDDDSQHIVRFKSENFMKLKAVEIKPDGDLVQITGKNAAGKTCVLMGIATTLSGKLRGLLKKPIRDGEERAVNIVETEKITATCTFTPSGSRIVVENKDGMVFRSPQAVLDELVGPIGFDPSTFLNMSEKEQRQVLIDLMGVDVAAHDAKIEGLKTERSAMMAKKKEAASELEKMPEWPDAPAEEVSVTELMAEVKLANETNKALETKQKQADADLKELARLNEQLKELKAQIATAEQAAKASQEALQGTEKVDVEEIEKRAEDLEKVNKQVRENATRVQKEAEIESLSKSIYAKYQAIQEAEGIKAAALAGVKMPVDGLSVDENGITYNGIPFGQVNEAMRCEIAVAIPMAQNPKLKILLMNGNGLDSETMQHFARLQKKYGYDIWMERVDESGKVGVVIEEGEVASIN